MEPKNESGHESHMDELCHFWMSPLDELRRIWTSDFAYAGDMSCKSIQMGQFTYECSHLPPPSPEFPRFVSAACLVGHGDKESKKEK